MLEQDAAPVSSRNPSTTTRQRWLGASSRREHPALNGQPLAKAPNRLTERPGREILKWHNSEVYLE